MAANDTTDLASQINVRVAHSSLSTAELLRLVDAQLLGFVAPLLKAQQQGFFHARTTQALTAGTGGYRVPERAIGSTVLQVLLVDSSGAEWPLDPLQPEQVTKWRANSTDRGQPEFYWFEGAKVQLLPVPDSSADSIVLIHERRPNRLVSASSAAVITNISGVTVTISSAPSGFTTAAQNYDFVSRKSPHECLLIDQSATRSSTTMTFTAAPTGVEVGDYVAIAQESPFPQIPDDLVPLLIDRVVAVMLPTLGDAELGAEARDRAGESAKVASGMVSPRHSGQAKKIPGGAVVGKRMRRQPR